MDISRGVMLCRTRPAAVTDRDLLARYAAGDGGAFADLVRRHAGLVHGVCRRALGDHQEAEDAAQVTFLLLAEKAASVRWRDTVANWLHAAARRVARNARVAAERRKRRERRAAVPEAVAPLDRMSGRELLTAVDEELARLPAKHRTAVILCCLEGLTRDEAAARLGVTPAAVKANLRRGRERLTAALRSRGVDVGGGLLALFAGGRSAARVADRALMSLNGAVPAARGAAGGWAKAIAAGLLLAGLAAAAGVPAAPPAPKGPPPGRRAEAVTVTGRVLTPDGKPAAGAKLYALALKRFDARLPSDFETRYVATADATGRFRAAVDVTAAGHMPVVLTAAAPGFGVGVFQAKARDTESMTGVELRLSRDLPIRGRVLDTEGKPVPGVGVSVSQIRVPGGTLDTYLKTWRLGDADTAVHAGTPCYGPFDRAVRPAVTDKQGRFTLRGVGAERVAVLLMSGGGVVRTNPYVLTRRGFDPEPYRRILREPRNRTLHVLNRFAGLHPPDFTLVLARGRTVFGQVADAATGRPLSGAVVGAAAGYGDHVVARTGRDGRYRLDGLPKLESGRYRISVNPPSKTAYLPQTFFPADRPGVAPICQPAALSRGSVVTGRLIDRGTGRGVMGTVRIAPLAGNEYFGRSPAYSAYRTDRTGTGTLADGTFHLVTIPGRSVILAQTAATARLGDSRLGVFRRAEPDPNHADSFAARADGSRIIQTAGESYETIDYHAAVKVIDLKERGRAEVKIFVDRGETAELRVVDDRGEPAGGVWAAGLTHQWRATHRIPGGRATVYALDSKTPRTLLLLHPERRLAGRVTVSGTETIPVVAKLSAAAAVTGRLIDAAGKPMRGVRVFAGSGSQQLNELYRWARPQAGATLTDKDGRFRLPAIVPGVRFNLTVRRGGQSYAVTPLFGTLLLKAGETRDFGDRTLRPR